MATPCRCRVSGKACATYQHFLLRIDMPCISFVEKPPLLAGHRLPRLRVTDVHPCERGSSSHCEVLGIPSLFIVLQPEKQPQRFWPCVSIGSLYGGKSMRTCACTLSTCEHTTFINGVPSLFRVHRQVL